MRKTAQSISRACAFSFGVILVASCASPSLSPSSMAEPLVTETRRDNMFTQTIASLREAVDRRRAAGVPVPIPADPGGGYTHEQHKQNGKTVYEAGMLYELTGEIEYLDFAADILADYADLYPMLDLHPEVKPSTPSRLFWQGLNEAVWLVYVSQGYAAIRDDLSDAQRSNIETNLLRPMADFLSEGSPQTFNRIHNHGTWAAAAVGMTGYTLDDRDLVDKALYGLDKSGDAGFLKQVEELFSPDGYYAEGPYYQRYALMPFILFAQAIDRNDPDMEIFHYRDQVLVKAITATIQQSYSSKFFPINDAIREKGLSTNELRYGVAIAYDLTGDPSLLSIALQQGSVVPTPEGRAVAEAIAAGEAVPFPFKTLQLRDGPQGDRGALIVLRNGSADDDAAIVFKPTSQGLGHGHFDRLGLIYYDNGDEIVADYGAARFLNVAPKNGGRYLPENTSWAKQTVAHNTLVVDQRSQFGGDWRLAEERPSEVLAFDDTPGASFAAAQITGAYDGVDVRRVVAMVDRPGGGSYVIDIVLGESDGTHTYDLPVHFKGQLIETNLPFEYSTELLVPMGDDDGYEHLWKTAETRVVPANANSEVSILVRDQFYTLTLATTGEATAYLTRLGANDPDNNLRNEQAMIFRTQGKSTAFASVYERHGRYDNDEEVTVFSGSSIAQIDIQEREGIYIISVSPETTNPIMVFVAKESGESSSHVVRVGQETYKWQGPVGLFASSGPGRNDKSGGNSNDHYTPI